MKRLKILMLLLVTTKLGYCFHIFPSNEEIVYKIDANVTLVPDVHEHANENSLWHLNGKIIIQSHSHNVLAIKLDVDLPSSVHIRSVESLLVPFKVMTVNDSLLSIEFKQREPVWSANIKRALISFFQVRGEIPEAFVINENGIYGTCPTEYFIVNKTNSVLSISKTYDMDNCLPFPGSIYLTRSNIPMNFCSQDKQTRQAITSKIANYLLNKLDDSKYIVTDIESTMRVNVQTFESYYPQFLYTRISLNLLSQRTLGQLKDELDVTTNMSEMPQNLIFDVPVKDATGGRSPKYFKHLVRVTATLLNSLADSLETSELKFDEPYDDTVSEIIRLMGTMDLESLRKLYEEIDIGTSYRLETSRNLFLEIIPRTGTAASILLTRDLITNKYVKPTTAIQLLISLPFYISEPSTELIRECESFLNFGPDRPDVRHAAVLSYATMIYNTFIAGQMSVETFEKYVKIYFDLFLNSFEYEQQMLYLEALGNLQLGNVAEYLDPIIKADYAQNSDIRFLAMWATMPTAHTRPEKVFETYWPIYYSKTSPLQLRVAAFTMLLISNPTPGRLLGLFNVISQEDCPHMINFYRTTVLSISETTYPCYQHLKKLLSYMVRHLPDAPLNKYWVTGNYLFDYRDRKFQIGSMLQTILVGERKSDLPLVAYFKFDTEALGRFTGQIALYLKIRGVCAAVIERLSKISSDHLKIDTLFDMLRSMKLPVKTSTPLHFEFILQFEGKAVLAYYLNQTSFHNLTEGDLINRINLILRADSHINMQIVRRPFMIKYSLPTMIGTPADILIESTVVATLRGNTTQQLTKDKITRNNQIDVRYSSYSVVKIRSYNPIEDVEYSTVREQGFLVYFPINNELMLNFSSQSFAFSFYRPDNLTSGLALKSRTRNYPLKHNRLHKVSTNVPTFQYNVEDAGVDLLLGINKENTKDNVIFMLETDVLDNAKVFSKVPFSFINNLLTITSLIQLNTIHISRDKHLTILFDNKKKSKIDGTIRWEMEDLSQTQGAKEDKVFQIYCHLNHKADLEDNENKTLHKWEFSSKYSTFKNSKATTTMIALTRKVHDGNTWKVCTTTTVDPMIFMKKPFTFTTTIVFGINPVGSKKCPTDKSRIDFDFTYFLPRDIETTYANHADESEECPKEIIKLSPPPYANCDKNLYKSITSVKNYDLNLKFERMPEYFKDFTNRVDHLIAAALPGRVKQLNITEYLKMSVKIPSDDDTIMSVNLNGVDFDTPFSYYLDAKYNSYAQLMNEYGFTSTCSIIGRHGNSFYNSNFQLKQSLGKDFAYMNDYILMAADCTESPTLAVFVKYNNVDDDAIEGIMVCTGGVCFTHDSNLEPPQIELEGQKISIHKVKYQYPPNEIFFDFKVYLNEENILVVENRLLSATIQFDMHKIISIRMPTIHKGKLCGVCSLSKY